MSGRPHRAVADIRYAVRATLDDLASEPGGGIGLVLVACSGGADSLALAEAAAFECAAARWRCGAVVVDHGLQPGSDLVADGAAAACRALGLDPVVVVTAEVTGTGQGLEAAAREARYAVLAATAGRLGAVAVLLGHTRDDQAEQVLLGLTRGSGARSLAGMPAARGVFRRPLLAIPREDTAAACVAEGLTAWQDPMNEDDSFTRVRARRALRDLERDLGPGVAAALARTADQLRADADLLDALADIARDDLPADGTIPVEALHDLPGAVRTRVWRRLLVAAGAPPGRLGATHTDACDRLLTDWHGQGPLHLPGDLRVRRVGGEVHITGPGPVE